MIVEIVILAVIAAFLGLRLYAVLGRRPEQNDELMRGRVEQPERAPGSPPKIAETTNLLPRSREVAEPERPGIPATAEAGIRAIVAAERRFDVGLFLVGARNAYAMVLDAYWKGDTEALAQLCDADVLAEFTGAIQARKDAGETLENRLIRIEEATLVDADYKAPVARIAVRFVADIAALTRDAAGTMVAGSLDDAVVSRDLWTFRRDLSSSDPDWLLDEADEG